MYEWTRYWMKRNDTINYTLDGFFKEELNINKLHSLLDKEDENLLILLGQPAMGKSVGLRQECNRIKEKYKAIFIDLRDYTDKTWLKDEITQTNEYREWIENDKQERLYIFMDAMDEALIQSKQSLNHILGYLDSLDKTNIFIRITCRSSEWPEFINSRLTQIFSIKEANFEEENILVLSPLTLSQINTALLKELIDVDLFWEMIENAKALSLTMQPHTLKMLINVYKNKDIIPTSKEELYSEGIQILCRENNETRQFYTPRSISHNDLLEIAQIIALVSIISGNLNIIGDTSYKNQVGYLPILKLQPKLEKKFSKIIFPSLQETLKSGLFVDMGRDLYTWSHKMNAEYLAAKAIIALDIDIEVLKNLFTVRLKEYIAISKGYLGVISWLLDERMDLLEFIIEHQPEVLFEVEFEIPVKLRKRVVGQIFYRISITDYNTKMNIESKYKFLYFEGIEEVLKNKFENGNENIQVEILKIVRDCKLVNLYLFLESAINENMDYRVLKNAVTTLIRIAPVEKKKNILAYLDLNDRDDEIRGIILTELWPNFITFEELLKYLESPKNNNYIGKYKMLLYDLEKREFTEKEVIDFTKYILENKKQNRHYSLEKIFHNLYTSSIQLVKTVKYKNYIFEFIKCMILNSREYGYIIYPYIKSLNSEHKRELILYLLRNNVSLDYHYYRILSIEDIEWIVDNVLIETDGNELLVVMLNQHSYKIYDYPELVVKMYRLIKGESFHSKIPCSLFDAWKLDDYRSQEYKREYEKEQEELNKVSITLLNEFVEKIDLGEKQYWVPFLKHLSLENSISMKNINLNLKELPTAFKDKIIHLAKNQLEIELDIKEYLTKNSWSMYEMSLFYIFNIVYENQRQYIFTLPNKTLKCWLLLIIKIVTNSNEEDKMREEFVSLLSKKIPNEFNEIIKLQIDITKKRSETHYRLINCIEKYGTVEVFEYLKILLYREEITNPTFYEEICNLLVSKNQSDVINFLKQEILKMSRLEYAIISSKVLLNQRHGWECIFPQMIDHSIFCKECLLIIAQSNKRDFLTSISTRDYLTLYKMLESSYPEQKYKEEPKGDVYWGKENEIYFFRNDLLSVLIDEGTAASYQDLEILKSSIDSYRYWDIILRNAREVYFAENSSIVTPEDFIEILMNYNSRIVETEEELITVLINVLDKVKLDLIGENSELFLLWIPNGKYVKPRSENDFSTFLMNRMKFYMERHNVVLNREVEWRPSRISSRGERTDIHVNAIAPDGNVITGIIEVKGNWNKELKTAMKDQLADRYLTDSSTRSGIYLVAWFESENWKDDYRESQRPIKDKKEASEFFDKQAEIINETKYYIKPYVMDLPY